MYEIRSAPYGFRLRFAETIDEEAMRAWLDESRRMLQDSPSSFGVFVDMRTLRPLSEKARVLLLKGQRLYQCAGMERSVVILDSPAIHSHWQRIAQQSGIWPNERYIDAGQVEDWETAGIRWITEGREPPGRVTRIT